MGLFNKPRTSLPLQKDPTRQYRYSYSGSDVRAFVYFEGMEDLIAPLESLHTISVSTHEAKGQARALGFRGIRGLSRGVRTIGGSLILTVIEDNPLRPIMDQLVAYTERVGQYWPGWSIDRHELGTGSSFGGELHFSNRMAPLLPPVNILLQYISEGSLWSPNSSVSTDNILDPLTLEGVTLDRLKEGGVSGANLEAAQKQTRKILIEGAGLLIRGIEFIDEGLVTSSNDVVTEVTLSFLAADYKPISAQTLGGDGPYRAVNEDQRQTWLLQERLFGERSQDRVVRQEAAWQTITESGIED